jgi:hypothetical protein
MSWHAVTVSRVKKQVAIEIKALMKTTKNWHTNTARFTT